MRCEGGPILWSPRSQMLKAFAKPREGGTCLFMLPGFRFLFAAIVLSMSILVFGLGAAALLRAAHEQFANNPSWHAAPEAMFAQQPEATRPVLATLRIEPPPKAQKAPDNVTSATAPQEPAAIAPPAEPAATAPVPPAPEQMAALNPEPASAPETPKPETAVPEIPATNEAAPAQADAPAAADTANMTTPSAAEATSIASTEPTSAPMQVLSPANDAAPAASAPAASEQASAPAAPDLDAASTKIATRGGPTVTIEAPPPRAKVVSEMPDQSAIRKRQQARRAAQRRKLAARARLAVRQALLQQAANPFAPLLAPTPARNP
jgi:hypothetical protein